MTTYKYKGQSLSGARVSGVVRAYDEYEAVAIDLEPAASWTLPLGTLLYYCDGDYAAAMMAPASALHANTLGVLNLGDGSLTTLIEDPIEGTGYAFYDVRGHLLDEIDRVVHIQLVHDLFELGVRKAADEQLLLLGLHFDECFRRQLLRQQPEKERQGKLIRLFKTRRHVRRVHRYENVPERGVFLPLDQRGERAFESDGSLCHRVLPPWIFMGS